MSAYAKTVHPVRVMHLFSETFASKPLFEDLILELRKKGCEQTVCFLTGELNPKMKIVEAGINVFTCDIPAGKLRYFKPSLVCHLARCLDEGQIDILHCQRHKATVYGTLAAINNRHPTRVVTTVHGADRTRHFRRRLLNWLLFKKIVRIFAVSEAIRKDVIKANRLSDPTKVITIYNGIDIEKFRLPLPQKEARRQLNLAINGEFLFGTAGRLVPVKGHEYLIQAFAKLVNETHREDLRLVIAGNGYREPELRHLTQQLKIADKVNFLGFREDIPVILKSLDVFVFPSLSEGLGLSLIEAMVAELPIIASAVGGIPEVLGTSTHSLLLAPKDVIALTAAMKLMLEKTSDERQEIGRHWRQRASENFTIERMVSGTYDQYVSVLSNR